MRGFFAISDNKRSVQLPAELRNDRYTPRHHIRNAVGGIGNLRLALPKRLSDHNSDFPARLLLYPVQTHTRYIQQAYIILLSHPFDPSPTMSPIPLGGRYAVKRPCKRHVTVVPTAKKRCMRPRSGRRNAKKRCIPPSGPAFLMPVTNCTS